MEILSHICTEYTQNSRLWLELASLCQHYMLDLFYFDQHKQRNNAFWKSSISYGMNSFFCLSAHSWCTSLTKVCSHHLESNLGQLHLNKLSRKPNIKTTPDAAKSFVFWNVINCKTLMDLECKHYHQITGLQPCNGRSTKNYLCSRSEKKLSCIKKPNKKVL